MEAIHFFGLDDGSPDFLDNSNRMKRQRHFSLEDYSSEDLNHSNSSYSSDFALDNSSKRVRQGTVSSAVSNMNNNSSPDKIAMILEFENDHVASQLRSELEMHLRETVSSPDGQFGRKVSLQIPPQLLPILSSHIMQEAANEPYGLKGCMIHIYYESETDCEHWASLDCDPDTVSTFELTLTLRQDVSKIRRWRNKLPRIVRSLSAFGFKSILIGTSYKLIKRRNYISNSNEEESMAKLF